MPEQATQNLTYKLRLNLTRLQHCALGEALEHSRQLYNAALEERIDCYRKTGKSRTLHDQYKELTKLRSDPSFANYAVTMQRWPLKRLDLAFKAFWQRHKSGKKPGFPRFRGSGWFDSFGFSDKSGWKLKGKYLYMKGIGYLRLHQHRPLGSNPVSLSITRQAGIWYACISTRIICPDQHDTNQEVGIDFGCLKLVTLSNGETIRHAHIGKKAEKRIRRAQRLLARAKRRSASRRRKKTMLARAQRKIKNTRNTWLHQISSALTRRFSKIAVEDLNLKGMTASGGRRKARLNQSLADAAIGKLKTLLIYKATLRGGEVIEVDPRYSSQDCSSCGKRQKLTLQDRHYRCECGVDLDRDLNAALNIAKRGGVVVPGAPNLCNG